MHIIHMAEEEPSVIISIPEGSPMIFGIGITDLITGSCMGLYDIDVKDKLTRDDIIRMLTILQQDFLEPLQQGNQFNLYRVYNSLCELFGESANVHIDRNLLHHSVDEIMENLSLNVDLNIGAWMSREQRYGFVDFSKENRNILLEAMFENAGIL